jgi:co-chaperonin GroES (HSP10)
MKFDVPLEKVKKLFIPDEHRERTRVATIIRVGEEVQAYKPGDRVITSYYAGVPIELPHHDLDPVIDRIARESEILALIVEVEGEE